jgi:signal transduction histidine kinase
MPELGRSRATPGLTEEQHFLSSVSREVQAMADAVVKYVELLAADLQLPSPSLCQMHSRAKRLSSAAGDLAELAASDSAERQLRRQDVDLEEAIEDAASTVYPEALLKEQRLVVDIDEEVGVISADPRILRRLLVFLLARAVRATPTYGTVKVAAHLSDGFPLIGVSDAGVPLEDEDLPHVFRPFVRAQSEALRGDAASELALALSERLAEAHGGNLWAGRSPDGGSTFFFTLE